MADFNTYRRDLDPTNVELGARIRMCRLNKGLYLKGLADIIGVSFQQLQKYEYGKAKISPRRLVMLSEIFDVSVSWLIGETIGNSPVIGDRFLEDKAMRSTYAGLDAEIRSALLTLSVAVATRAESSLITKLYHDLGVELEKEFPASVKRGVEK